MKQHQIFQISIFRRCQFCGRLTCILIDENPSKCIRKLTNALYSVFDQSLEVNPLLSNLICHTQDIKPSHEDCYTIKIAYFWRFLHHKINSILGLWNMWWVPYTKLNIYWLHLVSFMFEINEKKMEALTYGVESFSRLKI